MITSEGESSVDFLDATQNVNAFGSPTQRQATGHSSVRIKNCVLLFGATSSEKLRPIYYISYAYASYLYGLKHIK